MPDKVLIFGKDTWPHTTNARRHFEASKTPFTYIDVTKDSAGMKRMLGYSKNSRQVPVIVEGEKVTIGYGGSW